MVTDPVCGKRINRGKAHIVIEHEGVAYSLCCPLCQAEFERAPAAYAKPAAGEKVRRKPGRHPYRERNF
jgi:YHS domain-containing protein